MAFGRTSPGGQARFQAGPRPAPDMTSRSCRSPAGSPSRVNGATRMHAYLSYTCKLVFLSSGGSMSSRAWYLIPRQLWAYPDVSGVLGRSLTYNKFPAKESLWPLVATNCEPGRVCCQDFPRSTNTSYGVYVHVEPVLSKRCSIRIKSSAELIFQLWVTFHAR